MLMFAFFTAVFSSVSWLIYALLFVRSKLAVEGLWEQSPEIMLTLLLVIFLPILVIWAVFGYVNQYLSNRSMNIKQNELLSQLQKNQDYTDLVVRVMLDAEHEIKDGFVLNKFDLFISDMNEALGEIIQRCNIASSAQLDNLWQRVRRGEKWTLGKAIVEANKNQSTFNAWVKEKVERDKVFRGSLLEFCAHYQNLMLLLEKHDRDHIFTRMIESGVFGKVYSIIAPLSEGIKDFSLNNITKVQMSQAENKHSAITQTATVVNTHEETTQEKESFNDGEDDEYEEYEKSNSSRFSFLKKFNPFRRKEDDADYDMDDEPDPFFQALHNSFGGNDEQGREPDFSAFSSGVNIRGADNEPTFSEKPALSSLEEPSLSSAPAFNNLQSTLDNLRASSSDLTSSRGESVHFSTDVEEVAVTDEPAKSETPEVSKKSDSNDNDEDLVYPFGGWTDENNYNK